MTDTKQIAAWSAARQDELELERKTLSEAKIKHIYPAGFCIEDLDALARHARRIKCIEAALEEHRRMMHVLFTSWKEGGST